MGRLVVGDINELVVTALEWYLVNRSEHKYKEVLKHCIEKTEQQKNILGQHVDSDSISCCCHILST